MRRGADYYAPAGTEPGDCLTYSEVSAGTRDDAIPLRVVPYTAHGDYDGSTAVERSNYRVMLANHPELVQLHGSHGSAGLAYLGALEDQTEELREAIASLESYPLIDESDHSELESDMEWEAWLDYGRRDFARDLAEAGALDEIDPGHEHDVDLLLAAGWSQPEDSRSLLDMLWHDGCDALNVNGGSGFTIEGGGGVHFYITEWLAGLARAGSSEWSREARAKLADQMRAVAIAARVIPWIVPMADPATDITIECALHGIARVFS